MRYTTPDATTTTTTDDSEKALLRVGGNGESVSHTDMALKPCEMDDNNGYPEEAGRKMQNLDDVCYVGGTLIGVGLVENPATTPAEIRVLSFDVGAKNLACCLLRVGADPQGADDRIERWQVLCVPDQEPATVLRVLRGLETWTRRCTDVVIERQPLKNPQMTKLQHYLEMYCCAVLDKPVHVQDAKHKLAFAAATRHWPGDVGDRGWTYALRKKLSVQTTTAFLAAQAGEYGPGHEGVSAFRAAKKKDDYADCYLQAMAYAHHVRPLVASRRRRATVYHHQAEVKARKPTDAQLRAKRLTKAGVKFLLRHCLPRGRAAVQREIAANPVLARNVQRLFAGDVDACIAELVGSTDSAGPGPDLADRADFGRREKKASLSD